MILSESFKHMKKYMLTLAYLDITYFPFAIDTNTSFVMGKESEHCNKDTSIINNKDARTMSMMMSMTSIWCL